MSENPDSNSPEPVRSIHEIMADVLAAAQQKAETRAARKARLDQTQATPKLHIVAWVDLMGFREQLIQADTPEKFQVVYRRMREVHEEFGKETASTEPDQAELNASLGKRIMALSDGLVIALNLEEDSPAAEVSSLYERIASFLQSLRLAQARCASVGNFVRGGIDLGYFWFEDDIMLSPALVEAYNMETTLARNPVIILQRALAEQVRGMADGEGWEEGYDPLADLFRDCEWLEEGTECGHESRPSSHVMLNFMPVFLEDENPMPFLRRYYARLTEKRAAAPERAKSKYDWLIQYLREFVATNLPQLEEPLFGTPDAAAQSPQQAQPE